MRFFNIAALVLASGLASAVATPPVLVERVHEATLQEKNRAVVDNNLLPPNCSLGSCLGLTGEITCIISAIASGDSAALQKCLSNSVSEICSCAACIPLVANVLSALGLCSASNSTLTPQVVNA
ncbi:hypothetical protein N7474_001406 [Penicillium riverlandense]|uniref:uncharacterized protein n=1 Tax=Penicillium riverlandense TaxID=1903569 RepID=UPI002547FCA6|nr:uncharacterized protein N7474_001406 [Penicillium riverlandense]KAJ5833095.1 hypothetical protein N7474_001406 [Penicillium riverlandense]